MANVESWPAGEGIDQMEIVMGVQNEAAQNAHVVGGFRETFRRSMEPLLAHNIVDVSVYTDRLALIDDATDGMDDLQLTDTDDGVLGWNTIGGGRSGVHLSRDMAAQLHTQDDVFMMQHAAAHELAHGEDVQLVGELLVDGKALDKELLYEGHAEIVANREMGKSLSYHREGQPEELYGEGQTFFVDMLTQKQRTELERIMTGDGDLTTLNEQLQEEAVILPFAATPRPSRRAA